MEAQSEQQCPPARLVQELAFGPELVRELAQPLVQMRLELKLLVQTQTQAQLELEHCLQRSCPKPQLHRYRYKGPGHSQGPQLKLRRTQVHPKALD